MAKKPRKVGRNHTNIGEKKEKIKLNTGRYRNLLTENSIDIFFQIEDV